VTTELGYTAAFVVGILGGVHCAGMCGGIVGALTLGQAEVQRSGLFSFSLHLAYSVGRVFSYTLAGALAGGLGILLASSLPVAVAQRVLLVLAGIMLVLLGLYLGGWWLGLRRVEALGRLLWQRIEPLGRKLLPVRSPWQALALGAVWGWLPCGLVYSMLIWALAAGSLLQGAGLLLAFGLGTLPNLLLMGMLAGWLSRHLRKTVVRRTAGFLVLAIGLFTVAQGAGLTW
jgi:sulfite exporter TauE/SafE